MRTRQILMEQVRQMLSPTKDDRFCCFNGLFYSWEDINKTTWEPIAGAKGVVRKATSQCYTIKGLKIYF